MWKSEDAHKFTHITVMEGGTGIRLADWIVMRLDAIMRGAHGSCGGLIVGITSKEVGTKKESGCLHIDKQEIGAGTANKQD